MVGSDTEPGSVEGGSAVGVRWQPISRVACTGIVATWSLHWQSQGLLKVPVLCPEVVWEYIISRLLGSGVVTTWSQALVKVAFLFGPQWQPSGTVTVHCLVVVQ